MTATGSSIATGSLSCSRRQSSGCSTSGVARAACHEILKRLGYDVIGIDGSETLIAFAREADPDGDYRVADAADLPFPDGSVRLVTAFMSLHDVDDLEAAAAEAARVLAPGGHLCLAIVHPVNSAGRFEAQTPDAAFVIRDSYLDSRRYADVVERDGLTDDIHERQSPTPDLRCGTRVCRVIDRAHRGSA